MQENEKILSEYPVEERTAYLKAITALATADRSASEDEIYVLDAIAESADLPVEQVAEIRNTASTPDNEAALKQSLDVLKRSDLRFSLITDLTAFAHSDAQYTEAERRYVHNVAGYLGINNEQYNTIQQFVDTAKEKEVTPGVASQPQGFFDSLGLESRFNNSGMNFGNISKGLLGMLAPLISGKMMGRKGSGIPGGSPGGMLGGSSGSLGGGLGSLVSMISGGKGLGNMGGLLGRVLAGR